MQWQKAHIETMLFENWKELFCCPLIERNFLPPILFTLSQKYDLRPDYALRERIGCIKKKFVDSSIVFWYYTDKIMFGWSEKIIWLIKFGLSNQIFQLLLINLKHSLDLTEKFD